MSGTSILPVRLNTRHHPYTPGPRPTPSHETPQSPLPIQPLTLAPGSATMVTGLPATRTSLVLPQGEASSRHHGPDRTAELIHYTIGYSTPTLGVGPQLTRAPPGRIVSSAPGRSRISRSGDLQTLPWSRGGHAHVRRVTEQPSRMAHSEKAPVLWNCGRPMRSESTAGQHGPGPVSWPGQSDAPTDIEFLVDRVGRGTPNQKQACDSIAVRRMGNRSGSRF